MDKIFVRRFDDNVSFKFGFDHLSDFRIRNVEIKVEQSEYISIGNGRADQMDVPNTRIRD